MKAILLTAITLFLPAAHLHAASQQDGFNFMTRLHGDWSLAPETMQSGKATRDKVVAPMVGTDKTAMSFKVIGKGSTVQENLLPGTAKEMATMYHCNDFKNCTKVEAKHYCAKQNQPELVLSNADERSVTYSCRAGNAVCDSNAGHVHMLHHELINGGDYLKTTYTIYKDGKKEKDSVYYFQKKR